MPQAGVVGKHDDRAARAARRDADKRRAAAAPLAGLAPDKSGRRRAAQLALSYDVVDLLAMAAGDLPRPNLITWAGVSAAGPRGAGGAGAGVSTVARRRGRAGPDEEFRPVARRPGPEVGRRVAVDPRLRGGAVLLEKIADPADRTHPPRRARRAAELDRQGICGLH